jgi:prepilin-type N-terminal cleavage/methylation domain-containing protein
MNIFQKNNDDNGFTLIEVLMVMAILSIGILAVMTMQITAAKSNSNARRMTDGSNYMASEFERLMLQNYDDTIVAYPAAARVPDPPYTVANAAAAGPIPNTQQVDITVGEGPLGNPLTITYYKADPF